MKFVITAAGMGSRFAKIGIKVPKYQITAKGKSLFYYSMIGLKKWFNEEFIFIFRKEAYAEDFIKSELNKLGIKNYKIKLIDYLTEGQACTALLADEFLKPNDSISIFNIDTYVVEGTLDNMNFDVDGLVPVFKVEGDHWSFVKTKDGTDKTDAIEVSEKVRISDMASIGFYYFKNWSDYKSIIENHKEDIKAKFKEAYICPMYQWLIDEGKKVRAYVVRKEDVIALGTPAEVEAFDKDWLSKNL